MPLGPRRPWSAQDSMRWSSVCGWSATHEPHNERIQHSGSHYEQVLRKSKHVVRWCALMSKTSEHWIFPPRLINTGLYLLQDQSQEVRIKAACFASVLHHARRGQSQRNVYLMQVNQALPFLLDVLLEECWDAPGTLEVLMCHLPQSDLRSVLRQASVEGYVSSLNQCICTNVTILTACGLLLPLSGVPVCMSRMRPMCLQSPLWCPCMYCLTCYRWLKSTLNPLLWHGAWIHGHRTMLHRW